MTMADVRFLLRNERASRQIDHPYASYTATGSLECIVCRVPLKSGTEVWSNHLKSSQHAMRAERFRLSSERPNNISQVTVPTKDSSSGLKKRKASIADDDQSRKRKPKGRDQQTEKDSTPTAKPSGVSSDDINMDRILPTNAQTNDNVKIRDPSSHQSLHPSKNTVDEDEWAAFERDVATPPPPLSTIPAPSALTAAATISAAPLTATQLAAQAREQANTQGKEPREADIEGEKEDAVRSLEQEFDELENLEERVRRLKEKREELRLNKMSEPAESDMEHGAVEDARVDSDEQDSEAEDIDDWAFIR